MTNAIGPDLYWRDAPGAAPDDAAATARSQGGVPDERLVGDVSGAAALLRSLPGANGRVGVIAYCSGGRQSVLAACHCDLDAAVDDPSRGPSARVAVELSASSARELMDAIAAGLDSAPAELTA